MSTLSKIDIYSEKTVFIFGAGASNPYGFPLGPQLKNDILNYHDLNVMKYFNANSNMKNLMPEFKNALRDGDYETIDYFLGRKKKFRELGAFYIVTVIGLKESQSSLFPQRDLYADIFYMLNVESDSTEIPPISIISLNYDRSLEHFMEHNVKVNCHDEIESHALQKVKKLPIIHAHGSFGDISIVPYGKVEDAKSVHAAVNKIKIVSDKLDDSKEFQEAQRIISEAVNIIFLGFGYHPTTLKALFSSCDINTKHIYGTAKNLPAERKSEVQQFFSDKIWLGKENQDCSSFLNDPEIGLGKQIIKKQ
ncbi:MAG TPA: hypothetical protein DCZ94_17935 [Lentisphaeria bacterium]|nr:MAG: hypothetical protein A2X48_20700 [Lentisphaerae bacterium GWF2_49_21]HBC88827.1 hypothetical protein [Lentisphaeria bacterium]